MTEEQKHQINEMRRHGCTYRHIADTLSLKEGAVKSYCLRAIKRGLLVIPESTEKTFCKECGVSIEQIPKRKKRIFCSSLCRSKWWNAHLYLVRRSPNTTHHFSCQHCGKDFTAYANPRRKYCSHQCYIQDRYYREDCDGQ